MPAIMFSVFPFSNSCSGCYINTSDFHFLAFCSTLTSVTHSSWAECYWFSGAWDTQNSTCTRCFLWLLCLVLSHLLAKKHPYCIVSCLFFLNHMAATTFTALWISEFSYFLRSRELYFSITWYGHQLRVLLNKNRGSLDCNSQHYRLWLYKKAVCCLPNHQLQPTLLAVTTSSIPVLWVGLLTGQR